jgi:uncharacterized protein YndB with AHSA1/START domain
MATTNGPIVNTVEQDIVIERVLDAPLEQVWQAWTEPERLQRWWGPKTFTAPVCKIDFRPGGKYHYCMRSPDGQDFWSTGVFYEIVPLKRIVFTDSFADEQGNVVPATYYGMGSDIPTELWVTLTFEELEGDRTRFTLRHDGFPPGEHSDMTQLGWNESIDKLIESLK